jgi:molybdate transport system ATP-binding protein
VIALDGRTRRGDFTVEVAVEVAPGEVLGVVGENGAGKTTLLRVLAGLTPLDQGRLALAGTTVDEPATDTLVDPDRRPVGVAFQDPTLFPHLDLRDNVAFGLRRRGVEKAEARRRAESWLARVGLQGHERERPRAVSGGQAQRAALARALATEPEVLLLDEPLASLDQEGRALVRRLLRRDEGRATRATVLVTHDAVDALALTDRLVVLEAGRMAQVGTPAEITRRPRSAFVARLVGLNLLEGTAAGTTAVVAGVEVVTATPAEGAVFLAVAPSSVALYRSRPEGSPRNTWSVPVEDLEAVGDRVRVALGGPVPLVADVTPAAVADLGLAPGDTVWAVLKATEIEVYAA